MAKKSVFKVMALTMLRFSLIPRTTQRTKMGKNTLLLLHLETAWLALGPMGISILSTTSNMSWLILNQAKLLLLWIAAVIVEGLANTMSDSGEYFLFSWIAKHC